MRYLLSRPKLIARNQQLWQRIENNEEIQETLSGSRASVKHAQCQNKRSYPMREDGWSDRGPPTMRPYKEVKKKRLKKIGDQTSKLPLKISDLTGQGKDDWRKVSKVNDVHSNHINDADQPSKEVLDVTPIQMIVPVIVQGNVYKAKQFKNDVENVSENVVDFQNLSPRFKMLIRKT